MEYYKDDIVYLEISTGVFVEVKVLEVKRAYGRIRYVVEPIKGKGRMTVENLKKIK